MHVWACVASARAAGVAVDVGSSEARSSTEPSRRRLRSLAVRMAPQRSKREKKGKACLLDGNELSHALTAALEQTFRRFDGDGDGALSIAELQAFARACNDGEPFGEEELEQLRFFQTNESGWLTKSGFFQMYHTQVMIVPRCMQHHTQV